MQSSSEASEIRCAAFTHFLNCCFDFLPFSLCSLPFCVFFCACLSLNRSNYVFCFYFNLRCLHFALKPWRNLSVSHIIRSTRCKSKIEQTKTSSLSHLMWFRRILCLLDVPCCQVISCHTFPYSCRKTFQPFLSS